MAWNMPDDASTEQYDRYMGCYDEEPDEEEPLTPPDGISIEQILDSAADFLLDEGVI